jgi:hypothetical protein
VKRLVLFPLMLGCLLLPWAFGAAPALAAITPDTIIARAQSWVDAAVPYSQTKYYVSMAWELGSSYLKAHIPQVAYPITEDELQPGDILLNTAQHVAIFGGWADPGHTEFVAYEEIPPQCVRHVIPYPCDPQYDAQGFVPYRYDNIAYVRRPARPHWETRPRAASGARSFAALGDTGSYDIIGHVVDYSGNPVAGAEVDWGYWDASGAYNFGGTNYATDTGGDFAFSGVSGGHAFDSLPSDDLDVYYNPTSPGLEEMQASALDFSANNGTQYSYEMQPAEVPVHVANLPSDRVLEVRAGNLEYGDARADAQFTSGNGTASVLPMTNFDDVVAYDYVLGSPTAKVDMCHSQMEWLGTTPVSITAGTTAADTVQLDWTDQHSAKLSGPLCRHSGPAGRTVTMLIHGWPASQIAHFTGWDAAGRSLDRGFLMSTGATMGKAITIPATAPVGLYEIDTDRTDNVDSLIGMWDYYQVCTFKALASSILRGHSVRLGGKVPGTGRATLYSITRKMTNQPSTLTPLGWHKIATYKISSGKFVTSPLRPRRTTWYVVKYNGFAFPAFTQVVKVAVR